MSGTTPRELGFRMPAEWEPHEATWIAWPHNKSDWPSRFAPIPWVFCEIIRKLAAVETVRILIGGDQAIKRAKRMLWKVGANLDAVEFFEVPTDRVWTRDYAPLFVTDSSGEVGATDWKFNGWAKYENWHLDNAVNRALIQRLEVPAWSPGLVLEGGSIDVNGHGTLMTTEECLLSPIQARNPGKTREELEAAMRDYLGVDRFVWLGEGIAGDDTHGHVDDVARFADERTVLLAQELNPADPNHAPLERNCKILEHHGFRVIRLPMPEPVFFEGVRLPASYANFYIANRIVLVPTFNDRHDRVALERLAQAFPARDIVGIHALELVWGLGTLHCMTQQQPARGPRLHSRIVTD